MANPTSDNKGHADPNHLASPTVFTGNDGTPVVPTVIPPAIEFETGVSRPTSSTADDKESYFDAVSTPKEPTEPATANDASSSLSKPAQPHPTVRAGTAPLGGLRPSFKPQFNSDRPDAPRRGASFSDGLRRKNTATAIDNVRAPYSYQFDPASDSDSSSSDEEGQKAKESKQNKKNQVETSKGRGKRKAKDAGTSYNKFNVSNDQFRGKGRVSKKDGRLNISLNETANNGYIAKALGHGLKHHLDVPDRRGRHPASDKTDQSDINSKEAEGIIDSLRKTVPRPNLNIVIMVVGSRGDIQPFLKVGTILQKRGHRVRIATHPAFREFVQKDIGLEFFSIGGNPSELMAFMVKNPGLIPSMDTIKEGEIQKRRNQMAEMFEGFWRACVNATDDEHDKFNMKMMGDRAPFIANAIIANPPSFAHVHIAERLGIPLHIMFTFPYSPTQQFPHPLANIKPSKSNVDANYANFMSYPLVEMMTWQGLGDIVNKFRVKTLGLEPVSSLWAPGALYRMKVPYTYMWSSELIPKPKDWGPEIDISGFVFLDLASKFEPPKELQKFLDDGEPPVYIGFGSIVVDDPEKFTQLIFDAVKKAGVRALVSKGWGGLGGGDDVPDSIFLLENTPHDWLFPRCSAVVHHGGAGTTAIGLKCGKPTMIVPFFGDQPFWGAMVSSNKAGAHQAVPYKNLTVDRLADGIKQCLTQEAKDNTQRIADSIAEEGDGAENAVKSFERSLPLAGHHNMRCSMLEDRAAVWTLKHSNLRLSALAADILVEEKKIKWKDLRLLRTYEWNDFDGPGEPISGAGGALLHTVTGMAGGVGMIPVRMEKHIRKRDEHERKKKEAQEKRAEKKRKKAGAVEEKAEDDGRTASPRALESSSPSNERSARRPQAQQQATGTSQITNMSADPEEPLAQELAQDAGQGLLETGEALVSAPLDLTLAIAQGFHNAPRLYGDASVRKPMRITGFHSGLKAAGRELVFGVYDGVSGLVLQPVGGWKDASGVTGHITGVGKGFARGIGGFVLKDVSAIITPPAFVAQGVRREVKKRMAGPGSGSNTWIRRAHIVQGQKDARALQGKSSGDASLQEAQQQVDKAWRVMEEIWDQANHYAKTGGPIKGRISLFREKKKWQEAGALENITATERALKAKKAGKDLDRVFKQTHKEMDLADQPRASALQQPHAYEASPDVLANGQVADSAAAKHKSKDVRQTSDSGTAHSYDSDTTKVESTDRTASAAADGKTHERFGNAASKFDTGVERQGAQMTGQRPLGVSA